MRIPNRLLSLIIVAASTASSPARAESVFLGAGILCQNLLTTTTSDSGGASLTGSVYLPALQLSMPIGLKGKSSWGIAPSIYYTPLAKKQADEVSKTLLILQVPLFFHINDKLSWKAGLGFQSYTVGSTGGSVVMNNGTGTATFYRPDGSQSTSAFLLTGGVSWAMNSRWKLDADLFIPGAFSSRRSATLGISINRGFL